MQQNSGYGDLQPAKQGPMRHGSTAAYGKRCILSPEPFCKIFGANESPQPPHPEPSNSQISSFAILHDPILDCTFQPNQSRRRRRSSAQSLGLLSEPNSIKVVYMDPLGIETARRKYCTICCLGLCRGFMLKTCAGKLKQGTPQEGWVLQGSGRVYDVDGCQNYGPFLGTLNNRCRTILGTPK